MGSIMKKINRFQIAFLLLVGALSFNVTAHAAKTAQPEQPEQNQLRKAFNPQAYVDKLDVTSRLTTEAFLALSWEKKMAALKAFSLRCMQSTKDAFFNCFELLRQGQLNNHLKKEVEDRKWKESLEAYNEYMKAYQHEALSGMATNMVQLVAVAYFLRYPVLIFTSWPVTIIAALAGLMLYASKSSQESARAERS